MKIKDLPNRIQELVSEYATIDYNQNSSLSSIVNINDKDFWVHINQGNFKPFYKRYGFTGDIEGFPFDIVMKMCDQQVKQGNPWDVSVFEKDIMSNKNYGGFDWYSTEDGGVFWAEISYANFKPFYEKYYNKHDTVAVNEKVMNNNNKVMNNNGEVMNSYVYKVVPAETEGRCYGCCFYDEDNDMCDDICSSQCMDDCGASNIYKKVLKQTQLKYATNQGNVSATMDLLPPYDNLELEKVGITDNNQLTIYWKEKENSNITFDELLEKNSALKDTFKEYSDKCTFNESLFLNHGNYRAMMAYLKISHLMPYYGGGVGRFNGAYRIIYKGTGYVHEILPVYNLSNSEYPLFKTKEYAEKFMSREENIQLIKDLYMI